MGTVRALKRGLDRAIDVVMIALLAGIVLLVLLQIAQRLLPIPTMLWTSELSRYLFVYLTFIGSALLVKEKGHIAVDLLMERLPARVRAVVLVLVDLVVLAFLYVFISGIQELTLSNTGTVAATMPWFNQSYLYAGVWLGALLMFLYVTLQLVEGVRTGLGFAGARTEDAGRNVERGEA
ncbi:TRAP transporter small permease [Ornithinicoccus halotolerans]|uniref:TRAP transporter small permease n=1 Tax=Ornithinicoccus halotolerans TaxID=1748220 RepID=UPI001297238B|nr:TRAP transporter small permease subunit [Ornithinicoccus halotolerans]